MSSAATLPVALQCAHRAKPLRKDMVDFGIPLFANIHLCGSVLKEVFFCMAISKILYGAVPAPGAMVLFCVLLGKVTDMYTIAERMTGADKVIRP